MTLQDDENDAMRESFDRAEALVTGRKTMWAVVANSAFDGLPVWECHSDDDRGDVDELPDINLKAHTFPVGTRIEIYAPVEADILPDAIGGAQRPCDHDMGFDPERGPNGCRLVLQGQECQCAGAGS